MHATTISTDLDRGTRCDLVADFDDQQGETADDIIRNGGDAAGVAAYAHAQGVSYRKQLVQLHDEQTARAAYIALFGDEQAAEQAKVRVLGGAGLPRSIRRIAAGLAGPTPQFWAWLGAAALATA